jgi:hypothetical protein
VALLPGRAALGVSLRRWYGARVEKLIYVVWKPDDLPVDRLRHDLLGPTAQELMGVGVRALAVNLADEQAAFAQGLRITRIDTPMVGTVSVWVNTHLNRAPVERALARLFSRLAGYLVVESVPIVNTKHVAAPGARVPGICTVAFLQKPDALTYDAWLELWQGQHTPVAIETQSTFLYIQNVVVRALTADAPAWTAIVEEAFPAEAATDPMVFYDAGGSQEKLRERQRRMFASVQKFIDLSRLESHPMSSYVVKAIL